MAENTAKKFRLSFVNAAEDVPRLVRAYGKACQGEFAMVLRPPDQRGLLVLVRKEGAAYWRNHGSADDAPQVPIADVSAKDAVRMIQVEQKAVRVPGPITLRGTWSGWLHCDAGTPRVELERKLAQYGILRIVSGPGGWAWTVERTEKWFSKPGSDTGVAASLLKAIEGGLARAMGLLGEACSVRDTRRRAALDTTFATEHPVTPAHEGKDPTERLKVKEPRKTRAGTPPAVDAPAPVPDAPATPGAMQRMADEAAAEADALASIRDVPWVWQADLPGAQRRRTRGDRAARPVAGRGPREGAPPVGALRRHPGPVDATQSRGDRSVERGRARCACGRGRSGTAERPPCAAGEHLPARRGGHGGPRARWRMSVPRAGSVGQRGGAVRSVLRAPALGHLLIRLAFARWSHHTAAHPWSPDEDEEVVDLRARVRALRDKGVEL